MDRRARHVWAAMLFALGAAPLSGCGQASGDLAASQSPADGRPALLDMSAMVHGPVRRIDSPSVVPAQFGDQDAEQSPQEPAIDLGQTEAADAPPAMPVSPAPAFVEQAPRPLTELSRVPSVEASGATHDADDEFISDTAAKDYGATEPLPKCEPTDGLDGGDALPMSGAGAEAVEQTELPWAKSAINNEALVPVLLQVDAFTRRAFELADRGAAFSARAEFTGALRLITEALDTQQQTTLYSRSLTAGLTALKEADDFSAAAARGQVDVARTVAAHTTCVLKDQPLDDVSPLVARQRYLNYAKEQLTAASGMLPHSSLVLYGMGKLSLLSAPRDPASQLTATGRAMVWHQAALNADPRNFRAANELGVLLARHGDSHTARALFEQSLRMSSQPAVWSNLAEVEQRLGNTQQAALARRQAEVASRSGQAAGLSATIRWVDPTTFARAGSTDSQAPAAPIAQGQQATAAAAKPAKKNASNWNFWNGSSWR